MFPAKQGSFIDCRKRTNLFLGSHSASAGKFRQRCINAVLKLLGFEMGWIPAFAGMTVKGI